MLKQRFLFISVFCLAISCSSCLQMAKTGCAASCGNVSIPYPFGMDSPSCYYDESYKIICKNSSTFNSTTQQKPFLTFNLTQSSGTVDLEVLSISLNNATLMVNNHISSTCAENYKGPDLSTTPFGFSASANNFMAVGCDTFAFFLSEGFERVVGCMSVCDNDYGYSGCYGLNCCSTAVPEGIRGYYVNLSTKGVQQEADNCSYGFMVSKSWPFPGSSRIRDAVKQRSSVPVVLDWGMRIKKNSCDILATWSSNADLNSTFTCSCPPFYQGNPYLLGGCRGNDSCSNYGTCDGTCTPILGVGYGCTPSKSKAKEVIIGVSSSAGFLLFLIGGFFLFKVIKKRKQTLEKQKFFKRNGGLLLQQQVSTEDGCVEKTKVFTSEELDKATDHFSANRVLGQGGQGTVYKGMLTDGRIIAVKKSKLIDESQIDQFINEVVILSQINHRNVVKLLGCCLETEVPLLVYEFVPNGNLFQHIHSQTEEFLMLWETRLRIASEVANSLAYLHSSTSTPIYHRDIKSTNILLDHKYRAKVSDFGTSRSVSLDQTHLTTIVQGTFGYLDPEYFQTSQFTDKSDVYSFGVVLVELLTSQRPISLEKSQEQRSLSNLFLLYMEENRLLEIVDHQLIHEDNKEKLVAVAYLAKQCLNMNGKRRPTMKEVAMELEKIRTSSVPLTTPYHIQEECAFSNVSSSWDDATLAPTTYSFSDDYSSFSLDVQPFIRHTS